MSDSILDIIRNGPKSWPLSREAEWYAATKALLYAAYNQDAEVLMGWAFGDEFPNLHPAYKEEKLAVWRDSPLLAFSSLDDERRFRFLNRLISHYGVEVTAESEGAQVRLGAGWIVPE